MHAAARRSPAGAWATGRAAPNRPTTWHRTATSGRQWTWRWPRVGAVMDGSRLLVEQPSLEKTPGAPVVQVEMAVDARVLAREIVPIGLRDQAQQLFVAKLVELLGRDRPPDASTAGLSLDHRGGLNGVGPRRRRSAPSSIALMRYCTVTSSSSSLHQ